MTVHLAHVWSSHLGASLGLPLIKPFADRGWKVTIFCPPGALVSRIVAAGIEHIPVAMSRRFVDPVRDALGVSQLVAHYRRARFDIIHTHNIKVGWLAGVAAKLGRGARIVHTMHGTTFGENAPRWARAIEARLARATGRLCDLVLVQSNDDADALVRAGVALHKLVFIGNGVSLDLFDPEVVTGADVRRELNVTSEQVLFVSAGRMVREKGFGDLARAAALATRTDPNIRVAVAGPEDPQSRIALSLGEIDALRQHVDLLGQRDDMPALLAAADVVVLASHHEGMPRALMEGAAMAKPLLATAARGCKEVVNDPRAGMLVPVGDANRLAQAMIDLAADPSRRHRHGTFNRQMALARFDIKAVLDQLDRVYSELLG